MEFCWDEGNFDGNFDGYFDGNFDGILVGIMMMDSMGWPYDSFDRLSFIQEFGTECFCLVLSFFDINICENKLTGGGHKGTDDMLYLPYLPTSCLDCVNFPTTSISLNLLHPPNTLNYNNPILTQGFLPDVRSSRSGYPP